MARWRRYNLSELPDAGPLSLPPGGSRDPAAVWPLKPVLGPDQHMSCYVVLRNDTLCWVVLYHSM